MHFAGALLGSLSSGNARAPPDDGCYAAAPAPSMGLDAPASGPQPAITETVNTSMAAALGLSRQVPAPRRMMTPPTQHN